MEYISFQVMASSGLPPRVPPGKSWKTLEEIREHEKAQRLMLITAMLAVAVPDPIPERADGEHPSFEKLRTYTANFSTMKDWNMDPERPSTMSWNPCPQIGNRNMVEVLMNPETGITRIQFSLPVNTLNESFEKYYRVKNTPRELTNDSDQKLFVDGDWYQSEYIFDSQLSATYAIRARFPADMVVFRRRYCGPTIETMDDYKAVVATIYEAFGIKISNSEPMPITIVRDDYPFPASLTIPFPIPTTLPQPFGYSGPYGPPPFTIPKK